MVSEQLGSEIRALYAGGATPPLTAYGMWAQLVYPGRSKPRRWANDLYVYRLYDRSKVRFANSTLHDSVEIGDRPVGEFKGVLLHHSVRSIEDLAAKADERATYSAIHAKPKPPAWLATRLLFEFPLSFLRFYVLRRHFTGGMTGLRFAAVLARYRHTRIWRMLRQASGSGRTALELNTGQDRRGATKPAPTGAIKL